MAEFLKLTDEVVEKARATIGRERPSHNPWNEVASRDGIRHFAWGCGDLNPLWQDMEYARGTSWGTILAPPLFPMSTYYGPLFPRDLKARSKGTGLPGLMALYSGTQFKFFEPIRLNDEIKTIVKDIGTVDSQGRVTGDLLDPAADVERAFDVAAQRWGAHIPGRMIDQVQEYKTFASGKLAAVSLYHRVRVERGLVSTEEGKFAGLPVPKYTEEQLARIGDAYENEFVRGGDTLYWEDVAPGQELPKIVKGPMTVTSMITFLMGFGGPFTMTDRILHLFLHRFPAANIPDPRTNVPDVPERAHWDDWLAGSLGWPRGYDFGWQPFCSMAQVVTNWMGDDGFLQDITFWRLRPIFTFETMWVHGRVTKTEKSGAKGLVHLDLWGVTEEGARICEGQATVALKLRSPR